MNNEQQNKEAQKEEPQPKHEYLAVAEALARAAQEDPRAADHAQAARWKQLAKEKGVE